MKLSPYSFNGTLINDGTNYTSKFLLQQPIPDAKINFVGRGVNQANAYTGKSSGDQFWVMEITMLGTVATQFETLKALFDTRLGSLYTLIAKDTSDSDRQWSISAATAKIGIPQNRVVFITLGLDDIWKTVSTTTETTWSITSSGSTKSVTINLGNLEAYPIYEITPTVAKTGLSSPYKRFVTVYNQKTWAFPAYPLELTGGGLDTASLVADNSNKCQINQVGGITAVATTIPYDTVTGTMPSAGMIYVDTEQISYTGKTGTTSGNLTGCTRGVGGTTAAIHADNAVMKLSHFLANGADWRLYVDEVEQNRWLDGMNSATTKFWANISLSAKQEFTLTTAIASSGSITSIVVNEDISQMPNAGILQIDSERFTYTAKTNASRTFRGTITRAAKESSMAAHSSGATVRWIEHSIYLHNGNSAATPLIADDTQKPIINLNTSTNTSHVYGDFASAYPRSGEWFSVPSFLSGGWIYSANQGTYADPVSDMGIYGGRKSASNIAIMSYWQMSHPAGITNWNFSNGEKYNLTATMAYLQTNIGTSFLTQNTNQWSTTYSIPATTIANTWQSWSDSRALGSTYYHIRMVLITARTTARLECSDVTLTLSSSGVPSVTMGSEVTTGYTFSNAVLSNDTTGESLTMNQALALNGTIIINTLAKTITYSVDNSSVFPAITKTGTNPTRSQWLRLQQGANTLSWTETGVAGVSVVVKWQGRNN